MMETLDDVIEAIADMCGVYGDIPPLHPEDCQCRICFTVGLKFRILNTVDIEVLSRLTEINDVGRIVVNNDL